MGGYRELREPCHTGLATPPRVSGVCLLSRGRAADRGSKKDIVIT